MIKSAVMVFSKDTVNGCWKWGEHSLPKVSSLFVNASKSVCTSSMT